MENPVLHDATAKGLSMRQLKRWMHLSNFIERINVYKWVSHVKNNKTFMGNRFSHKDYITLVNAV